MDLKPPRGTLDLLPPAGSRMRALYDLAAAHARTYGFRFVETPGFEASEVFKRTSGETSDVVSKEMYSFVDRGDRELTLRPEGTAPVMRAWLGDHHGQAVPFKAYYLTRMYRYGRPQAGRYREHRQFGVEVFGAAEAAADVEVITLGDRFLRSLGLSRYRLEINSIGDAACRPAYREALVAYLASRGGELRDEHKDRFADNPLRVLDCKDDACRAVADGAPKMTDHLCAECAAHFETTLTGLRAEGIDPVITPTLVRGLDYYTRTAFEFVSEVLSEAQATVFGGGRYDGLAEALGGPATPGVGFGMGLERVLLAVEDEGLAPPQEPGLQAFVVGFTDAGRASAVSLLRELRAAGVRADAPFDERPLKAQLRMADRLGAAFAVLVGEREASEGMATLRRLEDGVQKQVPVSDVVNWLTRLDAWTV